MKDNPVRWTNGPLPSEPEAKTMILNSIDSSERLTRMSSSLMLREPNPENWPQCSNHCDLQRSGPDIAQPNHHFTVGIQFVDLTLNHSRSLSVEE
jgi:hypothetical protein